ncbi:MAG: serine hydrolase [Bacteroidetes bacterium]|nr:serine hydrolase [Bacteroidota bacterium]
MRKKKNRGSNLLVGIFVVIITMLTGADYDMENNVMSISSARPVLKKEIKVNAPDVQKMHFIDSIITASYKKGLFNGCVLVAEKGNILFKGAFGYRNIKTKDTLSTKTPFQLASVSKMFTAAAIMLLHEKGLLEYDDDLRKYIPDFPTNGISIRNLLNHRSGLQNYIYVADKYWDRTKVLNNTDIPALFKNNNIQPVFPANHHFNYCNTNYALLALVVEKISGFSFPDFMKTFVFTPLKMKNAYIYCKADENFMAESAIGFSCFIRGGMKAEIPDYLDGVTGDKGMYASVEDLFLYDQALYQNGLMKPSIIAEAFQPSPDDNGKTKKYGFGWRIRVSDDQKKEVYHYGWWRGFRTYFIREMTDKIAVISLNNRSNVHINNILCQILWYGDHPKGDGESEDNEE